MASSTSALDRIQIASPCTVDWASMTGDDRERYCGLCKLNVYNLGGMTRSEAETLISGSEGRVCARFARRADGTIVTQDCGPVRQRIRRRIRRLRAAAVAMFGLLSTLALSACGRDVPADVKTSPAPKQTPRPDPEPDLMGIVCPTPDTMGEVVVVPEEAMGRIRLPGAPKAAPKSHEQKR